MAERHGVLACVLRSLEERFDGVEDAALVLSRFRRHLHAERGFTLMLRQRGNAVLRAADEAGVSLLPIKGPVFAEHLYPDPALRRYTDIDLLLDPRDTDQVAGLLRTMDFVPASEESMPADGEWKWVDRHRPGVVVELQTDLIHAAALRRRISVSHRGLTGFYGAGETGLRADCPALLLLVAVVHGAGHHYERLLHVLDICQAARHLRGAALESRFLRLVEQCGARFAAVAGLELAGRLYGEPRCHELVQALGPVRGARVAAHLLSRSTVVSMMSRARCLFSWRRSAFRLLLKLPARGA